MLRIEETIVEGQTLYKVQPCDVFAASKAGAIHLWLMGKFASRMDINTFLIEIGSEFAVTIEKQKSLLKEACRQHTDFAVNRYLMANTAGRLNGAEKAQRHNELSQFYAMLVPRADLELKQKIHNATQSLTDFMDERIGFPLNPRPDYDSLAVAFFEEFHRIAMEVIENELPTK